MDKLEILLDMIEHPERYTEQQITDLLANEEMRKHYDVMVRLRGAYDIKKVKNEGVNARPKGTHDTSRSEKYTLPEESDTVHERNSHFSLFIRHSSFVIRHSSFKKIAAIFLAAAFLGGLSFAAYRAISTRTDSHQSPQVSAPSLTGRAERESSGGLGLLSFSNLPLDSILSVVSAHYNCEVCFRDSAAMGMKFITTWNPEDSLAAFIEHLNMFDGLHLTLRDDTIFVESTNDEEGEQ